MRLSDSIMLYQPVPNQVSLFVFNDKIFNQYTSKSQLVLHNQWVNIQLTVNQYQGYQMNIYDVKGRLISSEKDVRDLKTATVRTKQLRLFKGYRGLVKAFTLLTERVTLPYILPVSDPRSTCLV